MTIVADHTDLARRLRESRRPLASLATKGATADIIEAEWANAVEPFKKHHDALIDDLDQDEPMLDAIVRYIENPTWALILTGDYDTGKTFTAIAVARELCWRRWWPNLTLIVCRDLLASIKPGGGRRLADYTETGILVIDGLSEVELSRWDVEQVKAILLDRYEKDAPTIVTTNLEAGQLKRKLGGAIWSRFADGGIVLSLNDAGRRANRQRFAERSDIEPADRVAAYRHMHKLPGHLQPAARDQIKAAIRHDPLECGFTAGEYDAIEAICRQIRDDWNRRVVTLRETLEALSTGPNAPHQTYEWLCDVYRRQTGERFRLGVLNPDRIDGDQLHSLEAIAREVGIDAGSPDEPKE